MDGIIETLNSICGFSCVRYCKYSKAFFALVPFDMRELADRLETLFKTSGCKEVSVANEAGGECLQVSAYI